jgi:hypothetical protein
MTNVKMTVISATLITLLAASTGAQAGSTKLSKSQINDLVNICEALKSDSKLNIRQAIWRSGISKKVVRKGLQCNGMDAVTFALSHDANKSVGYLVGESKGHLLAQARHQTSEDAKKQGLNSH